MSELLGSTRYRLVVGIEVIEIINGTQQAPNMLSTIEVPGMEFEAFQRVKAAQIELAGIQPEEIEDVEVDRITS